MYVLQINPLLGTSFANIFSAGYLVVLFMVSFTVQKLLIRSHCLFFISVTLGDRSKKVLLQSLSENVLLMFSQESFCIWCKERAQFPSLACGCLLVPASHNSYS